MLHRGSGIFGVGLLLFAAQVFAGDWPEFRGPGQQGHSDEQNLPLTWSETDHIAWKTDIPGLGWSSPAIVGNSIWITTAIKPDPSSPAVDLAAICVDAKSGDILHQITVFHKDDPGSIHNKNSHASPTPVIEGDRIFVHFGAHGTACLNSSGDILWKTDLPYNHRHGPAGSPVIFKNLLIIACDGTDTQYITALDKRTGKEVWKKMRPKAAWPIRRPR